LKERDPKVLQQENDNTRDIKKRKKIAKKAQLKGKEGGDRIAEKVLRITHPL
jgi:hypothetical protein